MYLREQDVQDDNTWGAGEKKKKKRKALNFNEKG